MTISMYQASVPTFIHNLSSLLTLLDKASEYAAAKKFDPNVLVTSRLAPDMFPLARQIQIASDIVKGGAARLAGVDVPSYQDTESTIAELKARIAKTIDFLKTFTAQQIDGSEERTISLTVAGNALTFKGQNYLLYWILPNFYFHVTTAYDILRHNGVEIGKRDFLGNIQ